MTQMNLVQAINSGLRGALQEDDNVLVMGEDVGRLGGVFRVTEGLIDRFGAGRVRDIGVRSAMYSRTFVTALTLVGAVGTVLVYWLGGTMVINGTITIGTLTALSLLVAGIYNPLTSLSTARVDIMTAFVSFERVFEVLDLPPLTRSQWQDC